MQSKATVCVLWRHFVWLSAGQLMYQVLVCEGVSLGGLLRAAASSGSNSQRMVGRNGSCLRLSQRCSSDNDRLGVNILKFQTFSSPTNAHVSLLKEN